MRALERVCEIRGLEYRTCTDSNEAMLDAVVPWAVADISALTDCGVTSASWDTASQCKVPLLTLVAREAADRRRRSRAEANAQTASLIVIAPIEPDLHGTLNTALDLLIDGESGVWLLPSLQRL